MSVKPVVEMQLRCTRAFEARPHFEAGHKSLMSQTTSAISLLLFNVHFP